MTIYKKLPFGFVLRIAVAFAFLAAFVCAQDSETIANDTGPAPTRFRIGEKLSYNLSFGRFLNAGYADIAVLSRGKLRNVDVIEVRSRVKTFDVVSAAFCNIDETRTAYLQPGTGIPVYIRKVSSTGALPVETNADFFKVPTTSLDLLSLIYKVRESGGTGSFAVTENEQLYSLTLTAAGTEQVKTEIGDIEANVSAVQGEALAALGIKDMRIGFTADEHRVPVFLRFRTPKGPFRAVIASITLPEVPTKPTPTPTPTPAPTPAVKPSPTPDTYVDNAPLLPELGFQVGELLEYRVATDRRPAGTMTLNAKERKRINNVDTLVLRASVTGSATGADALRPGDYFEAQVDPDTLAPRYSSAKFVSPFPSLNQTLTFDPNSGEIGTGGKQTIDAPVGTHTVLTLIYAMRSFNLKPSKDPGNPVNDTRVAVFWGDRPLVFTLRPSTLEVIDIGGEKVSAQLISITTGEGILDKLDLKVWLGAEDRVPLRFSAGAYTAELVSRSTSLRK
ncbi:MAG: DUF3108 domain-containing protein [Chloracidobacterium sp.]|nr:DUF3108 domain-containing protein [Chloracidobacterium sp.]